MKRILMISSVIMLIAAPILAADGTKTMDPAKMQDMMKKAEAAATPGAPHKMLADLAGQWTTTTKMWMSPNGKPEESTGKSTLKTILGGRWLQQDFKSQVMGKPFEGMGLTGYDNVTGKYETMWFDTMSTGVMKGSGVYEAGSKTLKDSGSYSCPMTRKERNYRAEMKIIDKNNFVYSSYGTALDETGPEYKTMEITYKRAK